MLDIARLLQDAGQTKLVVPRPHPELVTRRVLVMERLHGYTISQSAEMRANGIDTEAVLRALLISFLEGAMIYGVFHGDLHAGNLFVLPDGRIFVAMSTRQPMVSQVLDIAQQTWTPVDPTHNFDGGSSVMYLPGKFLKTGRSADPDVASVSATFSMIAYTRCMAGLRPMICSKPYASWTCCKSRR